MSQAGLFCSKCGELNDAKAQFCRKCGAPQSPVAAATSSAQPAASPYGTAAAPSMEAPVPYAGAGASAWGPAQPAMALGQFRGYGGFWIRFVAVVIDGIVINVVALPLAFIFISMMGLAGAAGHLDGGPNPAAMAAVFTFMPLMIFSIMAINWLYEALMTSSSKQATLGKMALGLKVVTKDGNRLSFWHATGRHFAKLVSGMILYIGFIMAAFTDRKQALHDMIAGTYVVRS